MIKLQKDQATRSIRILKIVLFRLSSYTIFKIKKLKYKYPNKKIIVERIEDEKTFRQLKHAGCDYFQGFYFSQPEMVQLNNITPSKSIIFELVALVNNSVIDFSLIHEKISEDVALTTRILRIANNQLKNKNIYFSSINQSITYLGENTLRQFIMILAMSELNGDDSPLLSIMSLARARFISDMLNGENEQERLSGYMVGLISMLDIMLDQDLEVLLFELNISPDCVRALLYYEGAIGHLLLICKMLEKDEWFEVNQLSKIKKLDMNHLLKAFNKASKFANSVLGSIL